MYPGGRYPLYAAPLPGAVYTDNKQIWKLFLHILHREPDNPSELQEFTFFNQNEEYITYLEAYCIFIDNSTNEDKKRKLQNNNDGESLLVLGATKFASDSFQWISKNLSCINTNHHNIHCLFPRPTPTLNNLFHRQTLEYVTIKNKQKTTNKNERNKDKNKKDIKPTCHYKHTLHHLSPNELVNKHPEYFNGHYIGFICDICRATFPNTFAWHCAICQYDLCQKCFDRNAPRLAPLAPYAPQYNREATVWPPAAIATRPSVPAPTPCIIPHGAPMPGAAAPINDEYNIHTQLTINRYEDTFIYDNLYEYVIYNQDIYDKLCVFNGKKRYMSLSRSAPKPAPLPSAPIPAPLPGAPIPAPIPAAVRIAPIPAPLPQPKMLQFVSKNVNYSVDETAKSKMNMISITKYPFTVCYKIENDVVAFANDNKLHCNLKRLVNEHEAKYDNIDIFERAMTDKAGNILTRKWKVKGIIDPDKHLSTLQHSNKLSHLFKKGIDDRFDCISYHHWIPTVFKVSNNLKKCELLSEIPNLDPYEYGNTLYPVISQLFLSFVKQFEHITYLNLRDYELECIVKIQAYLINDISECDEEESYYGNFHKEGLYEDIMAVGLYYYEISKGIGGGELELICIKSSDERYYNQRRGFISCPISVCEGTQIVFNNYKCFHKVNKLYGTGVRKIIAFHLINPKNRLISAKNVIVNWKYHTMHFIKYYCRKLLDTLNVQFICNITVLFVVGDKKYIALTTEIHNECRRNFMRYQNERDVLGTVNYFGAMRAPIPD